MNVDPTTLTLEKLRAAFDLLKGKKDMGCDIHMWVEYAPYKARDDAEGRGEGRLSWWSIIKCYNPGRDYHMFNIMADCGRNDGSVKQLYENRLLPDHTSYDVEEALKEDGGDFHSHSWLTADEYAHCLAERLLTNEWGPPDPGWDVILCTMKAFEERGVPTRLIFAFDN